MCLSRGRDAGARHHATVRYVPLHQDIGCLQIPARPQEGGPTNQFSCRTLTRAMYYGMCPDALLVIIHFQTQNTSAHQVSSTCERTLLHAH